MRSINPETGLPYPRKKPVNWPVVQRILKHRQAHRDILARGFVEVYEFQAFPVKHMSAACVHPDGSRLYIMAKEG